MLPASLRRLDDSLGRLAQEAARAGLAVALVLAVSVTLTYQFLALSHRFPLDYGESPLVDQAVRLAAGQNIYRPGLTAPPFTISNYPPLYVAVLAPFTALLGPSFAVGRLVSTVAAWLAAGCLAFIIHTVSRDRLAAAATGLVFITLAYVTYWSGFLRVDLLALALSLAALALLVRWPTGRWSLVAAGLLLVAAVYTRQSYALAAPLAAFVWLLTMNWRRALVLAALVGGLGLALFALLQAVTGGGFYFNIVTANVNEYRLAILEGAVDGLTDTAWPLLWIGAPSLLLLRRWNPLYPLAAPYLVGAALSALTIGKSGSNVNYLLELCAALALAAGVMLVWARQRARLHALAAVLLVLLAFQAAHSVRTMVVRYAGDIRERRLLSTELYQLEALVAGAEGPVLADEYMGLSTLRGLPIYLQPFETTQLAWAGVWDQTPLLESIRAQAFGLILIYDRPWYTERWTPEMLAAIETDYRLTDRLADTRVYRPLSTTSLAAAEACPGAPWRLPASAARGMQGEADGLLFFGEGVEGGVPVYAVADGYLSRAADWVEAVAIEHDDPLNPGQTVWTYYADMRASDGLRSHVAAEFPPGSERVRVTAGQLVGYQGSWGGRAYWPRWIHVRFAVVRGPEPGRFPASLAPADLLDPAPYLGLKPELTQPGSRVLTFACATGP